MFKMKSIIILITVFSILFGGIVFASDDYPSRTITIIIGASVGGGTDTYIRKISELLSDILGVHVVVKNLPGAAGVRGMAVAEAAKPDGYTLAAWNPPSETLAQIAQEPGFDLRDMTPLVMYARGTDVLVTNVDSPYDSDTLPELIDAYKSGEISLFATSYEGTIHHVMMVLFEELNDINFDYLTYSGSGAVRAALMGKEAPAGNITDTSAIGPVTDGSLKALAVMGSKGSEVFPDLPTITDFGYANVDAAAYFYRVIVGPPGLPEDIQKKLEKALLQAINSEEIKEWATEMGLTFLPGSAEEAKKAIDDSFKIEDLIDIKAIYK